MTAVNIRDDYKLMVSGDANLIDTVISKKDLDGRFCHLRLSFEEGKCLGHRIGQYVQLCHGGEGGHAHARYYTPVSRTDEQGHADFLIKTSDGVASHIGEFTRKLVEAKEGDSMKVRGLMGGWVYEGFGRLSVFHDKLKTLRPENSPEPSLVFGHYVMIAHDSGVTAFINLINTISAFPPDRTSLTLLYFVEDIVLSSHPDRRSIRGRPSAVRGRRPPLPESDSLRPLRPRLDHRPPQTAPPPRYAFVTQ